MNLEKINRIITKHKSFVLSTHVNPDPDALCSQLALAEYLKAKGKSVTILNEGPVPVRYQFLPGSRIIQSYKKNGRYNFDAAFILDCGELDRIGKVQRTLEKHPLIINIDHHLTNTQFGYVNWVDIHSSSTAEMIYELVSQDKKKMTRSMVINLYVGILTDTGTFRHSNTTAKTHRIVSHLRTFDFPAHALYQRLYESIP
ncbi:MAG TPA: DHH family phosphoesterase, partial [Candidatus Omnitrophota bacterium]|nr:DHH family phosphoesterase [Candidatus Omnitrophota bacterium]